MRRVDPKEQELGFLFDLIGLYRSPGSVAHTAPNWDRVLELAVANGMVAQLHLAIGTDIIPPFDADRIIDKLRKRCRHKALRGLYLRAELIRLLAVFESAKLDVMPIKGPLLADRHYRDSLFRDFGDLDLLVRPQDREVARQLLEQNGYYSPYQNKDLDERYQIAFIHNETGELVELHWRIAGPQYAPYYGGEFLWANSELVDYRGNKVWTVSPEAELVYLAIHAYKHDWSRIQWLWDVHELLLSSPEFDWDKFWRLATTLRARRVAQATLQLTEALFCESAEVQLEIASRSFRMSSRQLELVSRRMSDGDPDKSSLAAFIWLRVALADTAGQRFRLLWHRMQPSDRDRDVVDLPRWLSPLYILIRPFRLSGKLLRVRRKPR